MTLDGAPGAAGPDLQQAGGAGRLGGTGPHSDPQVFSLLQLRVEKAALRLNAVPGAEIINWPSLAESGLAWPSLAWSYLSGVGITADTRGVGVLPLDALGVNVSVLA